MSVSSKLKNRGEKEAALPVRPAGACQKKDCTGWYIPAKIWLSMADGRAWGVVCYKPTCYKCGHVRMIMGQDNMPQADFYFTADGKIFSRNKLDFWVPRELVEEPVFDKAGVPVLDKEGKQILSYNKNLKLDFINRLLSLVKLNSPLDQYFTLEQIYNAKI